MAQRINIQPDKGFVKEVIKCGGDSVKKCYQCATCSIVCPLSSEENPFPRKEMLWTQWGLKDKLVKDPDIWLCYQCSDCSVQCPRDASPGSVLAAIRNYCFGYYAFPRFLGKAFRDWRFLPFLLGFPVIILLILLGATGHLHIPEGPIVFDEFVPHIIVDPLFIVLVGIAFVNIAISLSRFLKMLRSDDTGTEFSIIDVLKKSAIPSALEFITHKKFNECGTDETKRISHMYIVYGCLAFFVVTTCIFLGTYTIGIDLPLAMYNPLKIIANLGAVLVLIGCSIVLHRKFRGGKDAGNSSFLDWNLIFLIIAVVVLGLFTEFARLMELTTAAYSLYFVHLVLVFYGIFYFPYSKLAHLLYRSLAIIYADYRQQYMLENKPKQD